MDKVGIYKDCRDGDNQFLICHQSLLTISVLTEHISSRKYIYRYHRYIEPTEIDGKCFEQSSALEVLLVMGVSVNEIINQGYTLRPGQREELKGVV